MATAVEVASGYVSVYASITSSDVKRAVDDALRGITGSFNVKADVSQAAGALGGLSRLTGDVGKALSVLGAGVVAVGKKFGSWALDTMSDSETVMLALTNMTHSADLAKQTISQLQELAIISPYNFKTLETAGQRLVALGFSAQEVTPTLRAVGDAVAATGGNDANLTAIIHDLGQMRSQGKVTSRVMMNLANNSIASWQMLAEHLGVTVDQAREMVEAGAVSADEGITAILSGMESRYGGMMERASKTVSGIVSNMVDSVQNNIMGLSDTEGYGRLRDSLARLVDPLDRLFDALTPTFSGIMSSAAGWIDRVTSLIESLYDTEESAAGGVFTNVIGDMSGLRTAIHLVEALVAGGPGLLTFSGYLGKASKAVDGMGTAFGTMQGLAVAGMGKLRGIFGAQWVDPDAMGRGFTRLSQEVGNRFATLRDVGRLQANLFGRELADGLGVSFDRLSSVAGHALSGLGTYVSGALGALSGFANVGVTLSALSVAVATFGAIAGGTFVALGGDVSDLAGTLATDLGNIGGWVSGAIGAFAAALPELSAQLQVAIPTVLGSVNGLVTQVVGSIGAMLPQLVPVVAQLATGLGTLIVQNAPLILSAALQMMGGFVQAMADTINNLTPQLPALVDQLCQAIVDNAPAILSAAVSLFMALVNAFVTVAPEVIAQLPVLVGGLVQTLVDNAPAILSAAATLFTAIVDAIPGVAVAVLSMLAQLVAGAIAAVAAGVGGMLGAAAQFVSGMLSGAQQAFGSVRSFFSSIPSNLLGALGDVGGILIGAGRSIIDGFLSGLKASWGSVTDFVGGIASWIAANKGPIEYDRRLLAPHGRAIMAGLGSGLEAGFGAYVDGLVSDMSRRIAAGLSSSGPVIGWQSGSGALGRRPVAGTTVSQTFNTTVVRSGDDLYSASSIIHRNALREAQLV